VSTVSQYAVYTVTLYDLTGAQIGQPQKVLNTAPNVSAASGAAVAWQTLGSDVIANLLTPGGSGTSVTGSASVTVDWTAPASGSAYPNFRVSINSLGESVVSNGVQTIPAQPYDVDSLVVPSVASDGVSYSETFPEGFVDVLTSTSTASTEQSVQLQLSWQANNERFINTWQFNN
jgi:glucoamylase